MKGAVVSDRLMPHGSRLHGPGAWWKVVLLYGLACGVSLWLAGRSGHVATLWFANPVGSVALMLAPTSAWPGLLIGLGLANGLANSAHLTAPSWLVGGGWPAELSFWAPWAFVPGNLVEMVVAAWALRRLRPDARTLTDPWLLSRCLLVGGVLPVVPSSIAGASLLWTAHGGHWGSYMITWLSGSGIGAVVVLPLALAIGLRLSPGLKQAVLNPTAILITVTVLALAALAFSTLPHPFVAVSLLLALSSLAVRFMTIAVITVLAGLLEALVIREGVILLPPNPSWWGDSLFYLSVLESLLPGVLLSAALGGREAVIARLEDSRQRLRALYGDSPLMLHSVDPSGRLLQVSRHWLQKLGYREDEVLGRPLTDFLTPGSARYLQEVALPRSLEQGAARHEPYEVRCRDGSVLEVLVSGVWERDARGLPAYSLSVLEDVTERNRLAERSRLAEHDGLTGLPNRVLLQDRLAQACQRAARTGQPFAVGFIDLDGFKAVNDQHGHEAGDLMLREAARRLKLALREADTVSRFGGDEFVLLLDAPGDVDQLRLTAARLMQALTGTPCEATPADGVPLALPMAASLGLALYGLHGREPRDLLHKADEAMYRAKRSGRNGVAVASGD